MNNLYNNCSLKYNQGKMIMYIYIKKKNTK